MTFSWGVHRLGFQNTVTRPHPKHARAHVSDGNQNKKKGEIE
jgi:hypothetical protein